MDLTRGRRVKAQAKSPRLPRTPRRALIFSNYARGGTHLHPLQRACAKAGLAVDVFGSSFANAVARPEGILGDYDMVFAQARGAPQAPAPGPPRRRAE